MQLLDHVSITLRDLAAAKPFYKAVMGALGAVVAYERDDAIGFGERNRPDDDAHTCLAAGGRDEGAPGLRASYHPQYYAAFLLDPEGNKVEAVFHRGK